MSNLTVQQRLVVILPVFEDRESASQLIRDLAKYCPELPYIVAIDDGSLEALTTTSIADAGLRGEVIKLVRNVGHQRAIAVGICYVATRYPQTAATVVMDSDGEDSPTSVPYLLEKLAAVDVDVVVAERRKRSESWRFRTFYFVYRMVFYLLTGKAICFGNFTALSPRALKRLSAMPEIWVHLPASIITSKLRIVKVLVDRTKRYAGRSHMNFFSLALHGMRSLVVFADDVLVRAGAVAFLVAALALGLFLVAATLKLTGHATPGWFTTVTGFLILITMQAAVLTFSTLMITSLVRGRPPTEAPVLGNLIDFVERTIGEEGSGDTGSAVRDNTSNRKSSHI